MGLFAAERRLQHPHVRRGPARGWPSAGKPGRREARNRPWARSSIPEPRRQLANRTTCGGPLRTLEDLRNALRRLDGGGYPAYKSIAGEYDWSGGRLLIDHVQGDPFADPSRVRIRMPAHKARLPDWCLSTRGRRVASADYLHRALQAAFVGAGGEAHTGSGRSGEISILTPGQQVLARSAMLVTAAGDLEARFRVGLPARGRTILGQAAADLLTRVVPLAAEVALGPGARDVASLERHVWVTEDAQALRAQLEPRGLVAFLADGSCLPRASGVDDRPLAEREARLFGAPPSLRVTLHAPNAGPITGMGVPRGVTLIVGGGFHGKSTLLRAIERGVYDHIPGDGRERVVTVPGAVKIRAEDGRAVAGTDISNFIGRLPGGTDTRYFRTNNASGSTSQAAGIVEALEVGATCLLLDEDTSASNLLIRDARMQALIPAAQEPITPLVDRLHTLSQQGISTILVVGGSGDYLEAADTVIALQAFEPRNETGRARRIIADFPSRRTTDVEPWRPILVRAPRASSLRPRRGRAAVYVKTWSTDRVTLGDEEVDLRALDQLVETGQARAIAYALAWARDHVFDGQPLPSAVARIMDVLASSGLDAFQAVPGGELAEFRSYELVAFLNRVRSLECDSPSRNSL
jgi:predicted ABC-class ATPase